VSAEGQCSWYEFARKLFELEGLRVDLKPVSTTEFPSPVRRPAYSMLGKKKLRSIGIEMPSWEEGLSRYLTARKLKTQTIKAVSS
jgi:dTDP-4-dehydrorhamnose reductase